MSNQTVPPHPQRRRASKGWNTFVLIASLTGGIVGQLILFPMILSCIVDPFPNSVHYASSVDGQEAGITAARSSVNTKLNQITGKFSDGTFNGVPIYLRERSSLKSNVHCVGENYHADSWRQRSCRFSNLCFNTSSKKFIVFQSAKEKSLSDTVGNRTFVHMADTIYRAAFEGLPQTVSIGGINLKWGDRSDGLQRLQWFPDIQQAPDDLPYYQLPDPAVIIPFHSLNGANPGHLVWDDFLPMYTLMEMFQLQDRPILPLRYVLDDGLRGLWASCDFREDRVVTCQHMIEKFLPLLIGKDSIYKFTTTQDIEFLPNVLGKADLVCSKTAVAGMGSITDHGVHKFHGWQERDYETTHNHGRGGSLYAFRNFMISNMGLSTKRVPLQRPHRILFSQKSSDIPIRSMDFERQIQIVKENFAGRATVESYVLKDLSLQEQIGIAHDASIFITLCGGGAVTGMFLPEGASVILYYADDGGVENNRRTYKPALLDWDLFNSMSHLRVHWLPRNTMKTEQDERILIGLIEHELDLIESDVFS